MSNPNTELQEHQFRELEKFAMFTDAPGVQGRRSRLYWSSFRGNPRITVFTGVPDDTEKGVINAPMNPETFGILMVYLKEVIDGEPGEKRHIENYTLPKSEGGERQGPQEKIYLSTTWVGKDKEGVVWISVRGKEGRPVVVFKFQTSDFHKFFEKGQPITEARGSQLQALVIHDNVKAIMQQHASIQRPPYDPEARKQGGKGGYGGKSGGGGGQQQRQGGGKAGGGAFEDLDDDIPY